MYNYWSVATNRIFQHKYEKKQLLIVILIHVKATENNFWFAQQGVQNSELKTIIITDCNAIYNVQCLYCKHRNINSNFWEIRVIVAGGGGW